MSGLPSNTRSELPTNLRFALQAVELELRKWWEDQGQTWALHRTAAKEVTEATERMILGVDLKLAEEWKRSEAYADMWDRGL